MTDTAQQSLVDAWNRQFRVGVNVAYMRDDDTSLETQTRSKAELLSGHTAVIWLYKVGGCVALDRVCYVGELTE